MRVSRTQAAENRQSVINVASRLFRERGFDGIGLKDLMKSAGLTQGAFYKQFESKEDLAVQASERALDSASRRWSDAMIASPEDPLGAIAAIFLSTEHRDETMDGCPIVALGADAARQGSDVKASFEAGIKDRLVVLQRAMAETDDKRLKSRAMAILSTMVGAVTLSRLMNDTDLAQGFLDAAAEQVRAIQAQAAALKRQKKNVNS